MPPKYDSESEERSDIAESSDNYHVVPSAEEEEGDELLETEAEESSDLLVSEEVKVEDEEDDATAPPPHPLVSMLYKTLRFLLLPFCKIIFAPTAQKTFVKTTVMVVTISWIFVTSLFAYILFYNRHVPPITHVQPIWFNYQSSGNSAGPQAVVDILARNSVPLRHEQVYDVFIQLHVPTSDINFDIGNFMVDVQLKTSDGSSVQRSSRPAILRYQSRSQRIMRVFAKALPLLVGLTEESQVITTKLIDDFVEQKHQAVNRVDISISDPRIQIYDAKLMILAKFYGLRYYMYYHRIMTALTFIFIFASIEFVCATIAWKFCGEGLWHKLYQFTADHEQQVAPVTGDETVANREEDSSVIGVASASGSEKSD